MTKYDSNSSNEHVIVLAWYTSGTNELSVVVQPKNDYRPEVEFTFLAEGELDGKIRFTPQKMSVDFYAEYPSRVENLMEVLTRIEDYKENIAKTVQDCLMKAHRAMRSGQDKETDLAGGKDADFYIWDLYDEIAHKGIVKMFVD
ncbi:MAG: hypothetical protein QXE52_08105 [Candidatus Caldarchaeum sp.]